MTIAMAAHSLDGETGWLLAGQFLQHVGMAKSAKLRDSLFVVRHVVRHHLPRLLPPGNGDIPVLPIQ